MLIAPLILVNKRIKNIIKTFIKMRFFKSKREKEEIPAKIVFSIESLLDVD